MTPSLLEQANDALAIARESPNAALELATNVIAETDNAEVLATAHFACGLVFRARADVAESTRHLELARGYAALHPELRGQILRSLAFNYAQSGRNRLASSTVEESISLLSGQEQDLSRLQQAFMLLMRGDHRAALPVLSTAIESFTASSDDEYLELTLRNRALIHLEFGDYDASVADLEKAFEIAVRLNHRVTAADVALHLSQVLGWRDDIPGAMEWHDRSVQLRTDAGAANPVAAAEHAFVLIQARLMREAEEVLTEWIPRLVEAGDLGVAVQSRLQLADVLLARGAHQEAADQVVMAQTSAPADGRFRFDIAAAGHSVRLAAGNLTQELLDSMIATGADMEANGERHAAALERFRAVDVALSLGDAATAATMCDDAARTVRSAPLWLQIHAWTALAKVRMAWDNRRGSAAAVRAGFRRLDEYRDGIGAVDLRIHASDLGRELARIGIELALGSGSVPRIFDWSERLRTASLHTRPEPSSRPEMETALAQLRHATARIRTASPAERDGLRREQTRCERQVSELGRQTRASHRQFATASLLDVQKHLGDRLLVEFVESAGQITGIVVTDDRARLVNLGSSLGTAGLLDHLRFAAERIARPSTSAASSAAALKSVAQLIGEIRLRLIEPLHLEARRMVVIPSSALHGVPWGLVFDTPVEVAPSATVWLKSTTAPKNHGVTVVVTGPDLIHARAEAEQIGNITGGTVTALVVDALPRLAGAGLAHFACHARPRLDSPMFSSLVLDDGELTLYDIERLPDAPDTVVLAACDGGSAVLASGEEVLGLASAFLSLGARTVVAPIFSVSDEATATVMRSVHRSIAAGLDPAAALLAARQSADPLIAFTAGSFTCFGA